ncbi:hypothetical protein SAMN04487943_10334 [Gracilibacillus orientalis]|uniref:Uncharacterized protein n=1 Tax=Gracilibacillus orientalis TaxID=334253 RepID=A0A1I4JL77_9BACI|nr:hypothetical protein [Gracilibacillus orientalis]SFL67234.1 hypothetical protein SAMN04487943_10334 [Gracilibacillus orientalis]
MMFKKTKDQYKIQTFFEEGMQQRFIRVLDRLACKTFVYHQDEVELITNKKQKDLKNHLEKRMHLIRSGAYDTR